eukprot:Platyproteum_vivax@DN6873_c0_g1_i1.p1
MTTAHRPTWTPAVGGEQQGGSRIIAPTSKLMDRDLPGQQTLKLRQIGQGAQVELRTIDFKAALEKKERAARGVNLANEKLNHDVAGMPMAIEEENPFPQDADHEPDNRLNQSSSDEGSDSSDDDTEELMRELENIKRERLEEQRKQSETDNAKESEARKAEILVSNPLVNPTDGTLLKRRWDDDSVFRNQAKKVPKPQKRFINDTVRSDFHRKFLSKYIK